MPTSTTFINSIPFICNNKNKNFVPKKKNEKLKIFISIGKKRR
jgi:hypothetical protein